MHTALYLAFRYMTRVLRVALASNPGGLGGLGGLYGFPVVKAHRLHVMEGMKARLRMPAFIRPATFIAARVDVNITLYWGMAGCPTY